MNMKCKLGESRNLRNSIQVSILKVPWPSVLTDSWDLQMRNSGVLQMRNSGAQGGVEGPTCGAAHPAAELSLKIQRQRPTSNAEHPYISPFAT